MAVTFLAVARPLDPIAQTARTAEKDLAKTARHRKLAQEKEARKFAREYLAKFDKNEDGELSTDELPHSVRMFGHLDHNRDRVISEDELAEQWISQK